MINSINTCLEDENIPRRITPINDTIIAIIGCFWLFTVLRSFYLWNDYEWIIRAISAFLVFIPTLFFFWSKELKLYKQNIWFFIIITIYYIFITIVKNQYLKVMFAQFFTFSLPMLFMLCWPKRDIRNIYKIFRKIIIFYAIGSSIITILTFTPLINYIPHYDLPAQSALHIRRNLVYRVYIFFVTESNGNILNSMRACGMLIEPGHFSIILGFVYLIDKLSGRKINYWLVVCGICTFSFTFFIIAGIAEIYYMITNHKVLKTIRVFILFLLILLFIYLLLPNYIQDTIYYLIYERNMKDIVDTFLNTGTIQSALDERTNFEGIYYYEQFIHNSNNLLYGANIQDDAWILSDYRGMILNIGIIGLILSLLSILLSNLLCPMKMRIPLLCAAGLIFLHRSWMLYYPYIFFILYMASIVCQHEYEKKKKQKI